MMWLGKLQAFGPNIVDFAANVNSFVIACLDACEVN